MDRAKKLQEQQIKQNYKFQAEKGIDSIIQSYISSKRNKSDFNIDETDKSSNNRYYNRYWSNDCITIAMLILVLSFIASFYTTMATFGILAVFVLFYSYSQVSYIRYFTNDTNLSRADKETLKNLIFSNQLNLKVVGFLAGGMSVISYIISFFSNSILLDENDPSIVIKILHYFDVNFQNELFAYSITVSILILILLKIYEKWSN
jgi:hypothetical protein